MSRERIRIAVLRGGPSNEYEASLADGAALLKLLRSSEAYDPADVLIDRAGIWHFGGLPRDPETIALQADLLWNALRGTYGADGEVQKILERLHVPHTGATPLAHATSFGRHRARSVLRPHGVRMPFHVRISREEWGSDALSEVFRSVPMPMAVRDADNAAGDPHIARSLPELKQAFEHLFAGASAGIAEEHIEGNTVSCGVIRGFREEPLYSLIPQSESRLSQAQKEEIAALAKKIHDILGLGPYSESHFVVHPKRGVMFIEADSQPPFHRGTFAHGLEAVGAAPMQFVDHVISSTRSKKTF